MRSAREAAVMLLVPALALGAPCACAAAHGPPTPDRVAAFLRADARTAVEAGLMAQRRARSDGVRRLGRLLERDGKLAEARVSGLARGQRLRLAAAPGEDEERAMLVRLEGVPDAQFDSEFLLALEQRRALSLEELRAARATPDRRLAGLISRLLPVLEQERRLAQTLSTPPRAAGGG